MHSEYFIHLDWYVLKRKAYIILMHKSNLTNNSDYIYSHILIFSSTLKFIFIRL